MRDQLGAVGTLILAGTLAFLPHLLPPEHLIFLAERTRHKVPALITAQVRQELLARREGAGPKGLNSVVLPTALNQTEQMERAAREMAAKSGRNWQQHYAEQLMTNPVVYDQYLAANPAQTQTIA